MGCFGGDKTSPEREANRYKYEEFDGPLDKRGCRDVICFFIFFLFVVFMIFLFAFGVQHGDLYRLTRGYDASGNVCGRKNEKIDGVTFSGQDMEGKKYLSFELFRTIESVGGDVLQEAKKKIGDSSVANSLLDQSSLSDKVEYCVDHQKYPTRFSDDAQTKYTEDLLSYDPVSQLTTGGGACRRCVAECPNNQTTLLSRCVPLQSVDTVADKFFAATGVKDFFSDAVADVKISWPEIVYMSLIALGLSLIILVLLRFLAGIIVYLVLGLCALACIAGTALLWVIYHYKKEFYNDVKANVTTCDNRVNQNKGNTSVVQVTRTLTQACSQGEVNNFLAAAIVATIVAVAVLLIILVMRKRIALVIQLFNEAGRAVQAMPLLLLQPVWTLLALVIATLFWLFGLMWLESAGDPEPHPDTGYIIYKKTTFLLVVRWVYLFGFLWIAQFIVACQHMVVAGAVATWYFAPDKKKLGWPIWKSFWRLVRYHLGSVALGSFFIALIRFIRVIMHFIERRLKSNNDGVLSKPVEICLKCCQCCLWCFEKVLKFLTKNAYIEIAIHGDSFCTAARKAFAIITSNILRVAAINSVGDLILFFGKVVVVAGTVALGTVIMDEKGPDGDGRMVLYVWIPIIIGGIIAYLIADTIIDVYEMTIDTIFICFCEDCEMNDGVNQPYFMSKGLMEFVNNSSRAMKADKERRKRLKERRRSSNRSG